MIDSESGPMSAPPTPCTTRPVMSWASVCASAHAAELAVKIASPTRNRRRRPNRSPSLPPSRVSEASASEKALTVHSRLWSDAFRVRWIDGSATVTTVMSSMTMNSAKTIAPRIHQCRPGERVTGSTFLGRASP